MPVPTAITDLSTTAASNSPSGSESPMPDLDNYLRAAFAFIAQNYASLATKQASLGYTPVNRAGDTMTGVLAAAAGTASAPGLAFSGDTNTGLFAAAADSVGVAVGGSEKVRVNASGLGVATTPTVPLDVSRSDADGIVARFARGYGGSYSPRFEISTVEATKDLILDATGATTPNFYLKLGGTTRFSITLAGVVSFPTIYSNTSASAANVYVDSSGNMYRSTSSRRYKTDIADFSNPLQAAMSLRPVTYSDKSGGRFMGFIAEEVHEAGLTEAVVYNEQGEPDALHYGQMVAVAIGAIKELEARVRALEDRP